MAELLKAAEAFLRYAKPIIVDCTHSWDRRDAAAMADNLKQAIAAYKEAESKPVAFSWKALEDGEVITQYGPHCPELFRNTMQPLYTHPSPRRLTEDEVRELIDDIPTEYCYDDELTAFAHAIMDKMEGK